MGQVTIARLARTVCTDRMPRPSTCRECLFKGRLLHIHVAPAASYEMEELEEANLVAGRELKATDISLAPEPIRPNPDFREVTLIEIEALQALARTIPPCNPDP